MRLPRLLLILFAPLFLMFLAVVGGAAWLAASESGLRLAGELLALASGGRIEVAKPRGRLLGPLSLGELRWRSEDISVTARGVELDWTPAALIRRRLEIGELRVAELRLDAPPAGATSSSSSSGPSLPPDDLSLPLAVSARRVAVDSLRWNGGLLAAGLSARLASDGRRHVVEEFAWRDGELSLSAKAALDGRAPFPLEARAELGGWPAGRPLAISFEAGGTLARIGVSARAQGVDGEASATLTPFAARPFSEAQAHLRDIDPSAWRSGAPRARLEIAAYFKMEEEGGGPPTGRLRVTNHLPGPLDQQRVPLASAFVRAVADGGAARLDELVLAFPGDAVLRGGGRWSEATLTLDLAASHFDAARLVSRLFPTRFDGPLAVSLGAERQSVRLAWHDGPLRLTAEAEHAGGILSVKALELAAKDARVSVSGHVETGGGQAFAAKGTLRRFDPSRFARMPAARLDADFEAQGRLGAQAVVDGRFALGESRYAGMPLAGRGRFSLAWPRIYDVDIALRAGPNRLAATGGFGQPEDRLEVRVDAPRLAPFGVDGALRGQFALAGTMARPALSFDLATPRLAVPGLGTVSGLTLRGEAAGGGDSPFKAELALARFARPGEADALRAFAARVSGSPRAHRLEAGGELAIPGASGPGRRLRLAVEGGFGEKFDEKFDEKFGEKFGEKFSEGFGKDWRWLGQLRELRLAESDGRPRLSLRQPAPLEIAADGWSAGPLALAGAAPEWTAELFARADTRRLQADATLVGDPFGRIEGHLEAGLRGPWRIAADAPWRGRLRVDVADLAWAGGLLGEGWQTGGKLAGALALAGTPVRPDLSGRLDGSELALRLPEQGLKLTDGQLAAEFGGGLLRVTRLGFSSALTEAPRALRQALGDAAQRFAAPGRVDVSGELRIGDGATAENAFLDVRLDRFGAWQLPDQWVAVSGNGRVSWRAGSLDVSGELGVDAGYWQLAPAGMPRLSDDVRVERPEAPARGGARPNLDLDLDLKAGLGRRFLFRGAGLQTWLAGDVRLRARGRDLPRASGAIRLRDGRFDAYGQQLDIERGLLTFHDLLNDPALDVRAVRKGLAVEAGVQVGGSARRPVVRLVSDPELPDADKLAWLLLGHGPESMSAGDAALLAAAADDLLGNDSGGIVRQLKNTFGIDEFGVRQGDIGGNAARAPGSRIVARSVDAAASTPNDPILSVGKRLSANATLAYEQSLTKAESVVKLTVNLTRRVAVIARAGSDNALDIFYTLTFGQPPRRDSRTSANERKTPAE